MNKKKIEDRHIVYPPSDVFLSERQAARLASKPWRPQNVFGGFVGRVLLLPRLALIFMVRLYQWTLSPLLGRQCRFVPTCSNYMIQSLEKHGAIKGALKGLWRLVRCNPFCKGGYDPVE